MVGIITVSGLVLGIAVGILRPVHIPAVYSKYVALALLAGVDSILGGIKGYLKDSFDATVFFSGFLINSLVAALLGFLGDQLGIDLYLAAVIVFGSRIYQNIAIIRRVLLKKEA
ncbi:MAG: small basic family protein [Caldisericota bacterium]|jgi:small basic protein|nr:small basic family protein [Caldisericota bacterium]